MKIEKIIIPDMQYENIYWILSQLVEKINEIAETVNEAEVKE